MEEVHLYGVKVNSDLTEGRGIQYFKYFCFEESTALRMAKGQDVQGSDGKVEQVLCLHDGGRYYCPTVVHNPTREDTEVQTRLNKKKEILRSIKNVLSQDELEFLKGELR